MTDPFKPWHILARRTIYDSDWIGMQHLDIRVPDGSVMRNIHFVDYKHPAAAAVPIGVDGKILMIDHYRYQTDTRTWELPAGKIDDGETPLQAVARELREETGHRAQVFSQLGFYHPSNGSSNQKFFVFLARGVERAGEIEDKNEVMGLHWFTPNQVREMIVRNEFLDGLTLTSLCWAIVRGEI